MLFSDSCGSLRSLTDSQGNMAPKDIMTNSHAKSILNAMNSLRKSNTLCDITLRVDSTDFPAHRIVLAACSDYFCAMFTSEVNIFSVLLRWWHLLFWWKYSNYSNWVKKRVLLRIIKICDLLHLKNSWLVHLFIFKY